MVSWSAICLLVAFARITHGCLESARWKVSSGHRIMGVRVLDGARRNVVIWCSARRDERVIDGGFRLKRLLGRVLFSLHCQSLELHSRARKLQSKEGRP